MRLNQIQVIGTHNSYHLQPEPELLRLIGFFSKEAAFSLGYSHRPLAEQLELLQIRQVELDVYADPEGGAFACRAGLALLGQEACTGEEVLKQPGFKVIHIPHLDFGTTVLTFVEALEEIRDWSLAHPGHLPVMVLVEVKEDLTLESMSWPLRQAARLGRAWLNFYGIPFNFPPAPRASDLDDLDAEIRSVFTDDHLITPDHIRGGHASLEEAILKQGWPTLSEARGRVLFALDNPGRIRELYLEGRPALEGRVMFVSSPPGEPSAAFIKINDPTGSNEALIRHYVSRGYLVRTMADGNQLVTRDGDTARRDAALESGAQYVSTDFPEEAPWGYRVFLPGAEGAPGRVNPVSGPAGVEGPLSEWH
ncbi:MAG TPA: Ca2+-dependent phosphoinositide-specific phospholipase C [Bacillota bacterium]|nr:Ca2+-dependent phosphoinositide-specific phospholipase C [Bacillota bacterium]